MRLQTILVNIATLFKEVSDLCSRNRLNTVVWNHPQTNPRSTEPVSILQGILSFREANLHIADTKKKEKEKLKLVGKSWIFVMPGIGLYLDLGRQTRSSEKRLAEREEGFSAHADPNVVRHSGLTG